MHYLESYALNTACKISDPYIYEDFYPIPIDNYITLDNSPKNNSRKYKHWSEVVLILEPQLRKKNIYILQMNAEQPLKNCFHTKGHSMNQSAYIIKNGILHMGTDNELADMASHYGKKQVCLMAATHESVSKPFWGDESCVCMLPEIDENPSYFSEENPRTINDIKPEEVAENILKLLDIDNSYEYESLYTGSSYPSQTIHFVCDAPLRNYMLNEVNPKADFKIRLDIGKPDSNIFMDVIAGTKLENITIVTKNGFMLDPLVPFKKKLKITYLIEENNDPNFISALKGLGFDYVLTSYLEESEINKFKLNYMDLGLIHKQEKMDFKKFIKENEKQKEENFKGLVNYKSCKSILSNSKIFPSEYALSLNEGATEVGQNIIFEAIDVHENNKMSELFWKDSKYFSILKK